MLRRSRARLRLSRTKRTRTVIIVIVIVAVIVIVKVIKKNNSNNNSHNGSKNNSNRPIPTGLAFRILFVECSTVHIIPKCRILGDRNVLQDFTSSALLQNIPTMFS